jgi:hypothetical protein
MNKLHCYVSALGPSANPSRLGAPFNVIEERQTYNAPFIFYQTPCEYSARMLTLSPLSTFEAVYGAADCGDA